MTPIKMRKDHLIDRVCNCQNCTKIDMLFGDPLLNRWEARFIENLSQYGWTANYTVKQTTKLCQVWVKTLRLRKLPLYD